MMQEHRGETSASGESNFPWKKFWAVNTVAPKIKTFMSRAIHKGLAVSQRIGKFVEGVSSTCSLCNNAGEFVDHVLLHCNFSQAVWFAPPLGFRLQGNSQITIINLVESLFRADDNQSSLSIGMAICWAIWKCHNEKVFKHKNMNVHDALTIALYWYNLYYNYNGEEELNGLESVTQTDAVSTNAIWTPPDQLNIKINVDTTWKDGVFACAVVARDHNGNCHGVGTTLGRTDSVVFAEASGFQLAADLASWLNLNKIIIEGDNQIVVKSLIGDLRKAPWRIWRLKDHIIHKMAILNSSGTYSFVPKPANKAAHSLAAFALTHNKSEPAPIFRLALLLLL
ncbi:uncharacterized protein LOC113359034 [Papaver somniferum]|uniref:uncharacterized protein LOC113359034 n=1 Tax=Papaver somniferum TaxID=3469 RepID=UPI000E701125|nr:uncharacterized protein LOC113359034 [Papaver somniferum]